MTRTKARRLAGEMAAQLIKDGLIKPAARQAAFEIIAATLLTPKPQPINTQDYGRKQQY